MRNLRRILITGSRELEPASRDIVYDVLLELFEANPGAVLVEGGARGVDEYARALWTQWGGEVETHPADWPRYGNVAGPKRNQAMVNLGADWCHAFPGPFSRGTHDCIDRAEDAGIEVTVHRINRKEK